MKRTVLIIVALVSAVLSVSAQGDEPVKKLRMHTGFWSTSFYVGDEKVTSKEFTNIVKQKENAYQVFRSGKNLNTTGVVLSAVGGFCIGYDLGSRIGGGKGNTGMLISGGVIAAGGIVCGLLGEAKMKKGINLFNGENTACSLHLEASSSGMGLCLNF